LSATDRTYGIRSSNDDFESEDMKKISLNSFILDFVVGKGGFGKVWKVKEKGTNKIYAMKDMQKVKIISKKSVHSVMN
jgi:serine/threonine protein kinase